MRHPDGERKQLGIRVRTRFLAELEKTAAAAMGKGLGFRPYSLAVEFFEQAWDQRSKLEFNTEDLAELFGGKFKAPEKLTAMDRVRRKAALDEIRKRGAEEEEEEEGDDESDEDESESDEEDDESDEDESDEEDGEDEESPEEVKPRKK